MNDSSWMTLRAGPAGIGHQAMPDRAIIKQLLLIGAFCSAAVFALPHQKLHAADRAAGARPTKAAVSSASAAMTAGTAKSLPTATPAPDGKSTAAGTAASATKNDDLNVDAISAKIKQLQAATDDSQADRAKLLELYQAALDDLNAAAEKKSQADEFDAQHLAAPQELQLRKKEIATPSPAVVQLPGDKKLSAWEEMLDQAEHDLSAAEEKAKRINGEQQARSARSLEIPQALAEARTKLDEAKDTASINSADDSTDVKQARQFAQRARQRLLQAEVNRLEKEQQSYDEASTHLRNLEQEVAQRAVAEAQQRVTQWRSAVNDRRQAEADRQATEARSAATKADPAVKALANENSALADRRQELTKAIDQLSGESQTVSDRFKKLSDQYKQATDKFQSTGLTNALGQLLRKQRNELKTIDVDKCDIRDRQQEITRVQSEIYDLDDQSTPLRDLNAAAQEITALGPGSKVKPDDIRALLKAKRKYLNALEADDNSYFGALIELNSKQQQLVSLAQKYRNYIDERVLWIPSTHPLAIADAKKAAAAAWFLRPSNWWQVVVALVGDWQNNLLLMALVGMAFVAWAFALRPLRRIVRSRATKLGPNAIEASVVDTAAEPELSQTLLATLVAFLIAAFWPAAIWCVAFSLASGAAAIGNAEFAASFAAAFSVCAGVLFPLLFLCEICRTDGLAEKHFGWPADVLAVLRRQMARLMVFGTPLVLFVALFEAQSNDVWNDSLGRLFFIGSQLVLARFVFISVRPPHGPLHRLLSLRAGGWVQKLAMPILVVLASIPAALAALAVAGYYFTALQLSCRLEATVWCVLVLILVHAMATRWLKHILQHAASKQQPQATAIQQDGDELASDGELLACAQQSASDSDSYRLLHCLTFFALAIGMWLVWADVLPALRLLDQVTLWGDQGVDATHSTAITLADLLEACGIAVITILAAADLPSLLERAVLHRLPLDAGLRYALTAVLRYAIAIVGLAFAGGAIGIGWPKMQWLVAAVSFGLGFGLQEIFANFVSGLIVFWERPVRIGDTITVGDMTGVVSRIQMRATTIVDADRKELIVPNKEFITNHLVNWTLTDSVVRLVVPIGLAYNAEPQQAQRLLLGVAAKNPNVLKSPPAKAVFVGFGEKTLNFELRVFVDDVDLLMPTRHQLNMAIDCTLRAAGIDIAIPQRDGPNRPVNVRPTTSPSPNSQTEEKAA